MRSYITSMLRTILIALGLLSIISVIFSITARDQWWIRVFDYPRLQIAIISVLVLLLSVISLNRSKRWIQVYMFGLIAAVLWQGYVLHPYILPVEPEAPTQEVVDSGEAFSLLVANVLMENKDVGAFLELVEEKDPDVVLAIEPNQRWTEQLAPLRESHPYYVEQPQDNHYGMNLYSRLPLSETEIHYFENTETPSIYTVLTLPEGNEIAFYGTHPRPPLPENSVSAADKELIKIAQRVKESDRPVVVAGDFNDVPWSFTVEKLQEISQLRDIRVGRGFYNTFDATSPILRMPIDHVFISPHLGLATIADPMRFSSDHLALFTTLVATDAEDGALSEKE